VSHRAKALLLIWYALPARPSIHTHETEEVL
jgi:hypothetical protein